MDAEKKMVEELQKIKDKETEKNKELEKRNTVIRKVFRVISCDFGLGRMEFSTGRIGIFSSSRL